MKSCPTCNKTFTDAHLSFCIDDGTPLVSVAEPADETTVIAPSSRERSSPPPTEVYKPRDWQAPDYQPPGFQTSTSLPPRRKTWPWVVGILAAVLGMIAIAAGGLLVYKILRPSPPRSSSSSRDEPIIHPTSNLNSNTSASNSNAPLSQPGNDNSVPGAEDDGTPPPTDKEVVLAALSDLEQDWTVANINADKTKLKRILADDYVGVSNGRSQGKAEYLRTIKPDTTTRDWKFEDLRVNLMRDRATLEGVLRLQLPNGEAAFKFADKFVWRDGRWQAVSSEVSQIK